MWLLLLGGDDLLGVGLEEEEDEAGEELLVWLVLKELEWLVLGEFAWLVELLLLLLLRMFALLLDVELLLVEPSFEDTDAWTADAAAAALNEYDIFSFF